MRIKKVLVSGVAVLALAGTLAACGDDSDDDKKSDENSSQTTEENATEDDAEPPVTEDDAEPPVTEEDDAPATSADGAATVKVDGEELAGLDTSNIQCLKQGGKITVGSADASAGLGLVMTDEDTPKVESLGIMVDGVTLAVSGMAGAELGSADVAVDGDTYTVTGTAQGTDTAKPTELFEKKFEIVVTCS
ncbi:lipoprotein LpqH [Nocardioides alcanivorans]|uniref:lipoprotein LpqH n=1 Tax=Nocardioides alcanivorans TaxID=2897352 RepID=UPI001F30186B|nr:lipoprotein LpqH [Nocardioides alcanivorans]